MLEILSKNENYYDKYVNPSTKINILSLSLEKGLEELRGLSKGLRKLIGGADVGFGIRIKKK